MGFLDKQSRVIDVVLTERGRRLFATGELDFAYYAMFDDGIDYDPYSSGSLSHEEREEMIESTLMLEAPFIPEVRGAEAPGEPRSHVFTAAPDYAAIPHLNSPSDGSSIEITCDQVKRENLYHRINSSRAQIDLSLQGEVETSNPGFLIRVFSSGSNGLTELDPRRDLAGRRSYDPFIAISIDTDPIDPVDIDPAKRGLKP